MSEKDLAIIRGIKSLAAATLVQAAKDYCEALTPQKKQSVVKDLKSPWMDFLTNGTSKNVAEELQRNEKQINKRLDGFYLGGI